MNAWALAGAVAVLWVSLAIAALMWWLRRVESIERTERSAHVLLPARKHPTGAYFAVCACGVRVWGRTLPGLWSAHSYHVDIARRLLDEKPW